jgi:hypothetical protein
VDWCCNGAGFRLRGSGFRKISLKVTLAILLASVSAAAQSPADLRREAFDLAYNLEHDAAQARLDRALALAPSDGATHRAVATITWLNVLFQRGALNVDYYLGSVSRPRVDVTPPPAALDRRFRVHCDRAVTLARGWVARAPREAEAHYDLGAALGLRASYTASVEGKLRAGFQAARGAFDAHEKVLSLDPRRHDAGLVVGTYRYVVATMALPMRWMAYLAGFGGGRERGTQLLQRAAAYDGDSRTEARFALILIYNRERRFDDALRVIRELQRQFPRNRLLELEHGATALRAGRAADAEIVLSDGIARLERDGRPKAGGETAMWHYKRGAARVRLRKLDTAAEDLRLALAANAPGWIRGRATSEVGRIAELRGDRLTAQARYREAIALCERDRDPLGVAEARALLNRK